MFYSISQSSICGSFWFVRPEVPGGARRLSVMDDFGFLQLIPPDSARVSLSR